jgi:hypothetical protein
MDPNSSGGANTSSGSQKIPHITQNPKIHIHLHNGQSFATALYQISTSYDILFSLTVEYYSPNDN